jgi:ribose transport system ATP-binding protein
MVGTAPGALFPRSERHATDAILDVGALEPGHATFTLRRGEILGVAGLVGSGRTRLLRTIFGLEAVRKGRVRVGVYSGAPDPRERWRHGMGLLSEDRKNEGLGLGLSVDDNLTITKLDRFGTSPFAFQDRPRSTSAGDSGAWTSAARGRHSRPANSRAAISRR